MTLRRLKMKRWLVVVLMCFSLAYSAQAGDRELLSVGNMKLGGYVAPTLKYAEVMGDGHFLMGGQGACIVNDHIYLGIAGGTTIDDIGGGYSSYSYFGGLLGTFIKPTEAIHYFVEIGAYAGNISSGGAHPATSSTGDMRAEDFMFFAPGAGVAFNVSEKAKVTLGVSYRFASSVDRDDISDDDVGGYSVNVALAFGKF
jgi:hypothetical protein